MQPRQELVGHGDSPGFRDLETMRQQLTAQHSPMTGRIFVSCLKNWGHIHRRIGRKLYSVIPLYHILVFLLTWPWVLIIVLILNQVFSLNFLCFWVFVWQAEWRFLREYIAIWFSRNQMTAKIKIYLIIRYFLHIIAWATVSESFTNIYLCKLHQLGNHCWFRKATRAIYDVYSFLNYRITDRRYA